MAGLVFDENSSEFDLETNNEEQNNDSGEGGDADPELESIRQKVREMEAEAEKLKAMQSDMEKPSSIPTTVAPSVSDEDKLDADSRSIYVGNVDYAATAEELEQHFHTCGAINRITILCNKFSGQPKGFAYIEFAEKDSVEASLALDESTFRTRALKVMPKRTNVPGVSSTNRYPGGRGRFRQRMGRMFAARGPPRFRRRPAPYWYAPY